MRPPHVNAVAARREIAPQEHLRLCISTQINEAAANNGAIHLKDLHAFRFALPPTPALSSKIREGSKDQGGEPRQSSSVLIGKDQGAEPYQSSSVLIRGGPVLRPALCMSGHHRAEIRREGS